MRIEELYQKLGFIGKDGFAILSDQDWTRKITLSSRMLNLIQDPLGPLHQMSALFVFSGKPLIFFFEKPQGRDSLFRTIWNLNDVPIVIIMDDDHVDVYNGFKYEKELHALSRIDDADILEELSYFKIVTGSSWESYKSRLGYRNRVDYYLLKNIEYAQEKIQIAGVARNLANRLIGKIIFLRYLIDRHVMVCFEGRKQVLTTYDLLSLLQDKVRLAALFEALQDKNKGFNGDLFKISQEELAEVPNAALAVLIRLLNNEDLETDVYSLFDVYDFSILPVEFISNVYERFIGRENQELEGAYYTPYFLVEYIVENTVSRHLSTTTESGCKVLDPACGSGIFLVEALRRIIDHYRDHATAEELKGKAFQNTLCKLAKDNVFGIDRDESAVQVAAFSIYLTLLDYQQPADISTFRFPNLLGTNLMCKDAFDETPFTDIKFDYILGNPPWRRRRIELDLSGKEKKADYEEYIKNLSRMEGKKKIIGNNEIAQAFVVRTLDFMSDTTKTALVLTSKLLYNSQSAHFRGYLLEKVLIDSVLELSSVRKEVFSQSSDPSVAPACVLFYQKKPDGVDVSTHLMTHIVVRPSVFFTLFKVLTIEKADIQYVRQELVEQYDYLWKILLYGSYMDFQFIKRLRAMKPICQEIKDRGFVDGQGVTRGKKENRIYDISHRLGKRRIEADDLIPYLIKSSNETWQLPRAQRGRKDILFKAPLLLVRKSTGTDFTCRAAVTLDDAVYSDAITGVHGDDVDVLRNIVGLLNSRIFPYYALMNLSSIGTEREQAHNIEKFSLPYISGDLYTHVKRIEALYNQKLTASISNISALEALIDEEKKAVDDCVCKGLNMTVEEKSLVDYALNYTIPLITGKAEVNTVLDNKSGHDMLMSYAKVFLDRFYGQFGEGNCLNYECKLSGSHVMLRFFVQNEEKAPEFKTVGLDVMERFLLSLSTEKLSDNLYLRKDIRGFEKKGFYIVKPSEQRLWHPAIAYVDVEEFVEAMMLSENEKYEYGRNSI